MRADYRTKMQIIMALEVLAQERAQTIEPSKIPTAVKETSTPTKNLKTLVDVLFDRLYIWQMVDQVESIIGTTTEARGPEKQDEVREFCLQVVVP